MMKRNVLVKLIAVLSLVGVLALCASTAEAGKGKKKKGGAAALFKKLDANNDGKVSADEFAKIKEINPKLANKKDKAITKRFTALDTNNDGYLSPDELAAGAKKKKKSK